MDAFSSSSYFTTKFQPQIKLIFCPPKHPIFYISSSVKDSKPTLVFSSHDENPNLIRVPIRTSSSSVDITKTTKVVVDDPNIIPSPALATKRTRTKKDPQSLTTTIFNKFDSIINNFIDPAIRPSVDPKHVLANNFAPVDEIPPTDCTVIEGMLPPSINGAYIRNGPNPQHPPRGPYHLFEGDGMLHSLLISNGTATFCSRYVKTYRYTVENEFGSPVFPNLFSGFNSLIPSIARGFVAAARILLGQFNPINGIGLANTSIALFGNKLFALGETDLPYEIKLTSDGEIVTVGRHDFDGKLCMSMTPHPKVDPDTGEAFAFRFSPIPPFLTFFWFDSSGTKQKDVPIFSMTRPSLLHDFAITKKYAIFTEIQIGMKPMNMGNNGLLFGLDLSKVSRIGVISRYAKDDSDMKWFDVPGFNIIHTINAWDEGDDDEIVLIAPNILSVEHALERMELVHVLMEKVRINLKTGLVSRHPITARNLEYAAINRKFTGKKNRFIYAGVGDPMPKISGVVKLDLGGGGEEQEQKDCTVSCRMFGSGCYGGEMFYVAREPDNPYSDEDDGYVVTYMHDENSGESKFLVLDAKSPTLDVVAAVNLPGRVPYGFHGLFVRDSELMKLL